ncbi:MAG: MerR family transcriptional regulator [Ruminococcaceae bacterium]|nr:MerR family transcriptional regulator [Oscillospiraceae bacterium]
MTGKEIESRSGVARANIRYYEAEGLLHPAREKNGYRDYSEKDLEILEKIKLLRRLGVTIEELKALCAGKTELKPVLERRLAEVRGEQESLSRVEQVCGQLRSSGETFATLDAPKYLRALDEGSLAAPKLPEIDKLPAVYSPWRRFFARTFDELLWGTLLVLVFCLVGKNPKLVEEQAGVLWTIMGVLLGFALEPLLISLTGTTPGKILLGMRLAAPEGRKLTISEAYSRHFVMLWHGVGFYIPIWSWIQMWRSLKRGWNEEPQPWDAEVAYIAPPFEGKFVAFMAAAAAVLLVGGEAVNSASQLPPNRGDLTLKEFVENHNRQSEYLGLHTRRYLDEAGQWQEHPEPEYSTTIVIDMSRDWDEAKVYHYTMEDGRITAITMEAELEDQFEWITPPIDTAAELIPSFVWAQEEAPFWSFGRKRLLTELERANWEEGFTIHDSGVVIRGKVETDGYNFGNGWDWAIPDDTRTENKIAFHFSVELEE